ncbi:glycosyltransferase [Paenibacillus sp. 1-18]|uniref:glycosyltransferase n=1 Tax=Paenibacillus sp. 1-18 TaxID=1333846 RepID=UPI0004724385|nr:glycosyltransferase [Paenibacillus sp. 1-18]
MDFTGERFIPQESDKELEIEHFQRYSVLKQLVKGKTVLDAACGEGYGSYLLANSAAKVVGIDIDSDTIEHARRVYPKDNLEYYIASIERMPFQDNSFDIIVSFETLEHVDEELQILFLKEVKRLLKDNGTFVVSTPNKKYYSDLRDYTNPYHVKELYKDEFSNFLKDYFKYTNIVSQRFEVVSLMNNASSGGTSVYACELNDSQEIHEKYMIAFCSDFSEYAEPKFSITPYPDKYQEITERILSLQNEVEERNKHINVLDQELFFLRERFAELDPLKEKLYRLEEEKSELHSQLENYKEQLVTAKALWKQQEIELTGKYEQKIVELKHSIEAQKNKLGTQIENQKGHIELLLRQERILNNIYQSGGWRMLQKYYHFRDWLVPANSKRRVVSKLAARTVKHPKVMLSALNKSNLRKLKYYLKSEDSSRLGSRIDTYVGRFVEEETPVVEVEEMDNVHYEHLVFPEINAPKVSIIIPVYNQWKYTYLCLASILRNTDDVSYEVIIADDMSNDETINIANYVENIKVVRDGVNRGFLLNCNNAAKVAEGEYLFFLNNDTNVQKDWLNSLVELIESDQTIGMVGSKLVYPDGRQQEAGGIIWNDASGWNFGRLDDPSKPEYNYVKEVDYVSGAAILLRHNLWKELKGFDERYVPAYFEDTDIAFEIRRLGYKVMLQPRSVIVHFEGISHGTDTGSGIKSYQVTNKEKFKEKWKAELAKDHFGNAEHLFWARDRSRYKKTVVIVDHYVPHYDKDAGGRCTFLYTKLLRSMGFHVIFIGDNFFKHEPYTTKLEQMGVEVLYGNEYAKHINKWIKNNAEYIDYVYLNRPHISVKYIDVFKKHTKAKIIYFGHDLHYIRELRNYEISGEVSLLKASEEWKKVEFELFEKSDVIHVVGEYEKKLVGSEFPNKLIRNIPLFLYDKPYDAGTSNTQFNKRSGLLFVGGFNHTPNFDGIIWFIDKVLPYIFRDNPNIKLYVVGSNPPEDLMARQSERIIITGYVTDGQLEEYYRQTRLVVVPLRFGAGVKGKVVESLYYQVPLVATSIGAEGLKEANSVMEIADEEQEFADHIIRLYTDETKWAKLSALSGEYIKKYFTDEAAERVISLDITQ